MYKYNALKKKWKEVIDSPSGSETKHFTHKDEFDQLYGTLHDLDFDFVGGVGMGVLSSSEDTFSCCRFLSVLSVFFVLLTHNGVVLSLLNYQLHVLLLSRI
jgi:hypothetical protein